MSRLYVILIAVLTVTGCAGPALVEREFGPAQVARMGELKPLSDPSGGRDRVACLEPGDRVPMRLGMDSELLDIEPESVDLVVLSRLCFWLSLPEDISRDRLERIAGMDGESWADMDEAERSALYRGMKLYISRDATHWAEFGDGQAVKEALGIKGGTISAGMGYGADKGIWTTLRLKTVAR